MQKCVCGWANKGAGIENPQASHDKHQLEFSARGALAMALALANRIFPNLIISSSHHPTPSS